MACNGLDYLISGILAIGVISGFRQGAVRASGGLVSSILAIVVAAGCYRELAFWVEKDWGLQSILAGWLNQKINTTALPALGLIDPVGDGLADPAQYLAYIILLALCFLLLFASVAGIGQMITAALNEVLKKSALSGVNRLLGMAVQAVKLAVIISILIGAAYPAVRTGAQMGFKNAGSACEQIEGSVLAQEFLSLYRELPVAPGLNV